MGARQGRRAGKKAVFIGRYIYRPIDTSATFFFMPNQTSVSLADWEAQYARLRGGLAQVGWISDGYVQDRGPGAGGPHYQWTRKVRAKTVSVALSKEQYEWLKEAVANWRKVQQTLKEMQQLSRRVLFETLPHPRRRKRLGKRVLALISLYALVTTRHPRSPPLGGRCRA